jgi:hypothetical protein
MTLYRALPDHLIPYSEIAIRYFDKNHGLKQPRIEEEIDPSIRYRPTVTFVDPEKYLVCVEIVDSGFPEALSSVVLDLRNSGLPVKLWIAQPDDPNLQFHAKDLRFARDNGIGLLTLQASDIGTQISSAVSQSVCGLRKFDLSQFPANRRHSLQDAVATFRNGNPTKGCAQVYDELESLTRAIGRKASGKNGYLRKAAGFDWDTEAWGTVVEFLKINFDRGKSKCPELKPSLFAKVATLTDQRNSVAHKPTSTTKLTDRDRKTRTRFEEAMDVLAELAMASKPLRI